MINQLFLEKPSLCLLQRVLACFGLSSLRDYHSFMYSDMRRLDTLQKLGQLRGALLAVYAPCKSFYVRKSYTHKHALTALRQIVKTYGYTVCGVQKRDAGNTPYRTFTLQQHRVSPGVRIVPGSYSLDMS